MEVASKWNQPVPLSTKLVMVLADLEERKKLAFSPSFSAAEYVLYIESIYSWGTIASFRSSLWWLTIGWEDAKMSFKNLVDLCPFWWGTLAPLFLLGAEGEMIAADWKHGIFQSKTRSRPRYNVTTRDASMAGETPGDVHKLLSPCDEVGFGGRRRRRWLCASGSECCCAFALPGLTRRNACCALDFTQERRLLGREKHAHMAARRRGLPKTISCHGPPNTHTLDPNWPPLDKIQGSRIHVGRFVLF